MSRTSDTFRRNLAAIESFADRLRPTPSLWAICAAQRLAERGIEVEGGGWIEPAPLIELPTFWAAQRLPRVVGLCRRLTLTVGSRVLGWGVVIQQPAADVAKAVEDGLRLYARALGLTLWTGPDLMFRGRDEKWHRSHPRLVLYCPPGTVLPAPRHTRALDAAVDVAVYKIVQPIYEALTPNRGIPK